MNYCRVHFNIYMAIAANVDDRGFNEITSIMLAVMGIMQKTIIRSEVIYRF